MTFTVTDMEAPFLLIPKEIYESTDQARMTTTKTITTTTSGAADKKSKFSIRVYSGTHNEDLISLIVTINQFKAWAEAKEVWNTPPA